MSIINLVYETPRRKEVVWYDFTNSSLANIWNDRTITGDSYTTYNAAYGIFRTSYNETKFVYNIPIDLSDLSHKLKIYANVYTRDSSDRLVWMTIQVCSSSSTSVWDWIQMQDNWYDLWIQTLTWDAWISANPSAYNSNSYIEAIWDFDDLSVICNSCGRTVSWTMSSSQLSTAKTFNSLRVYSWAVRLKDVKVYVL